MGPNGPSLPRQAEISISILALVAAEMGDLQVWQEGRAEYLALGSSSRNSVSLPPPNYKYSLKYKHEEEDQHVDRNKICLEITWGVGRS